MTDLEKTLAEIEARAGRPRLTDEAFLRGGRMFVPYLDVVESDGDIKRLVAALRKVLTDIETSGVVGNEFPHDYHNEILAILRGVDD